MRRVFARFNLGNLFDPKRELYWFWGIAWLALFVELCFHALLPISISNDSYGYLSIAHQIGNPLLAFERSVGYPTLLYLLGITQDTLIPVILVQAMLAVMVPLIIFKTLLRFGLSYAILGGFLSCTYFYNFIVSLCIVTDSVYVFSLVVYVFFLVRYFCRHTVWDLMFVIASCWLIALIRVDGTQYFLAFLVGMVCDVIVNWVNRDRKQAKIALQHVLLAIVVFISIASIQKLVTNRVSSIIWPHFVFNWVYKADISGNNIYYGIIKPENGQAAKHFFHTVETIVTENPNAFNILKSGGAKTIQALVPEKNGKYSQQSVKLLMNDLIYNNIHDTRSWWIVSAIRENPNFGIVGSSKIMSAVIIEAFMKHPEVLVKRMRIVLGWYWYFMVHGIQPNNISFATAYHQQVSQADLSPGVYKQWVYDLYQHTGHDPMNREFDYPNKFPLTLDGAIANITSDNLIGFGHYIGTLGMQVLRLCWGLIILGIFIFPFTQEKSLLASLLCASVIPPTLSVLISEVDLRHALMVSPIQITTAVFIMYLFASFCGISRKKNKGGKYAT